MGAGPPARFLHSHHRHDISPLYSTMALGRTHLRFPCDTSIFWMSSSSRPEVLVQCWMHACAFRMTGARAALTAYTTPEVTRVALPPSFLRRLTTARSRECTVVLWSVGRGTCLRATSASRTATRPSSMCSRLFRWVGTRFRPLHGSIAVNVFVHATQ